MLRNQSYTIDGEIISQREADKVYLSFIRGQKCCVPTCSCMLTVPHHIRNDGKGRKCSDYETVPLCANHHTGRDGIHSFRGAGGKSGWEAKYKISLKNLSKMYNSMYIVWKEIKGIKDE